MPGIFDYHGNGRGAKAKNLAGGSTILPKLVLIAFMVLLSLFYGRRHRLLSFPLLLLIAALFFSRVYWREVSGLTIHFEQLACGLLFLAFLYDLWKKKIRLRFEPLTILVLCLLPLMILSSLLESKLPLQSLKKTLVLVPYFLAFLALVHYWADKERLRGAWDFFYFSGTLALAISLAGFCLFFLGLDSGMVRMEHGSFWLRGTMVIPNILGSTAVLIFAIAFIRLLFKRGPGTKAWGDMAALVIATACVMLSFTRAAWVGAVLAIAAVLAFSLRRIYLKSLCLCLALIVGTSGLTYLATSRIKPPQLPSVEQKDLGEYGESTLDRYWRPESVERMDYEGKIEGVFEKDAYSGTIKSRLFTLKVAWRDWLKSPLIGRGTESLLLENKNKGVYYISSSALAFLHDWGLIGLLLHGIFLFWVFGGLLKISMKTREPSPREFSLTLLVILIVSLLMNQTATTMQLSIFWVLLAFYASAVSLFSPSRSVGVGEKH